MIDHDDKLFLPMVHLTLPAPIAAEIAVLLSRAIERNDKLRDEITRLAAAAYGMSPSRCGGDH